MKTPEGVFCGLVGSEVGGIPAGGDGVQVQPHQRRSVEERGVVRPLDVSYSRPIEMRNGIAIAEKELARISRMFENLEVPGA